MVYNGKPFPYITSNGADITLRNSAKIIDRLCCLSKYYDVEREMIISTLNNIFFGGEL